MFLSGSIEDGLHVAEVVDGERCALKTGIDELGRATMMMQRYSPDQLEHNGTVNGTGAVGDEDEYCPDQDDEEEVALAEADRNNAVAAGVVLVEEVAEGDD